MLVRFAYVIAIFLGLAGCWQDASRDTLMMEFEVVKARIKALETQTSPDEIETLEKIKVCREMVRQVEDLIVESDYKQGLKLVEEISQLLGRPSTEAVSNQPYAFEVFGQVEAMNRDAAGFDALTDGIDLAQVGTVRTGSRSGAILKFFNEATIFLPAHSEIELDLDIAERRVLLRIKKGVLRFTGKGSNANYQIGLDDFSIKVNSPAELEMLNQVLGDSRYVAVYQGGMEWEENGQDGILSQSRGFKWSGKSRQEVIVPLRPLLRINQRPALVYIGKSTKGDVPFRWNSQGYATEYQLQISKQDNFVVRVYDQKTENTEIDVVLEQGTYFWRVRGITNENVPGPFSPAEAVQVRKGKKKRETQSPVASTTTPGKGPFIDEVKIEIITSMVIVKGRTEQGAKVSVNGITALLTQDGRFEAILNFVQNGEYDLRIIAIDPKSGKETIEEKKVKIQY